MTTKVFRWDDADAPQLKGTSGMSDTRGQLLNILDKCLVDGYGDKTSLGWERTHTDTYKRVFRIPAGMSLRVEDTLASWYWQGVKVRGYDYMTSIDAGVGGFPNSAILNNSNWANFAGENFGWLYYADDGQSTVTRRWVIVGDEKGFWIWVDSVSPTSGSSEIIKTLHYFGEFISDFTGDMYATLLTGMSLNLGAPDIFNVVHNYGITQTGGYVPSNGMATCASARKYDGIGGAVFVGLFSDSTAPANYASLGCGETRQPLPPQSAKIHLHTVDVLDSVAGYSSSTHQDLCIYRGRLPGIALLSQASVGQAFDTFQDDLGNSYILLQVAPYQVFNPRKMVAIKTSNWR